MNRYVFHYLLLIFIPSLGLTQSSDKKHNSEYIYHAKLIHDEIRVDGVIDEADWLMAEKATDFHKVLPVDTGYATQPSEILVAYNSENLYLAIIFYDTIPGKRVMESYRRDFSFGKNDNFLVFVDPFLDQTTGYSFGVSASGAKWDGTMSNGSSVSLEWDCKWVSVTGHYADRWVTEMEIPFKSINYPEGSREWNINFSRLDLKSNEKSSWAPVPRQFPTASLAHTGTLIFEEPLPHPKPQISVIPYVFGSYSEDEFLEPQGKFQPDFGVDAKIGLSSAMNLDLTYNPDFAQVEVDQQVTNIDRFELFFPEKRQFFLENSDLFSGYGFENTTPFFSRRIGLDAPVIGGLRLNGKVGNDVRVGVMNMTTKETSEHLARNYTVASVQKKVFARSSIGVIAVNKEFLGQPDTVNLYNRVLGMDYNLASKDNTWTGKIYYHRSWQPGEKDQSHSQGAMLSYKTKNLQAEVSQASVGENYDAEVGFIRRNGYQLIRPAVTWLFVPNRWIVNHGPTVSTENYFSKSFDRLERHNELSYIVVFRDRSEFNAGYQRSYVQLDRAFDPTQQNEHFLLSGSEYNYGSFMASFVSTARTSLNWAAMVRKGGFYNGDIQLVEAQLGYRIQPFVNMSMNINYTDLDLPKPFGRHAYWLLGPKFDVTFTDKIFWTMFLQYNEQIDNFNVNMRFQWRYQPVSDIFLVYTDNYSLDDRYSKNRALVFKMTYWLN